MGRGVTPVFGLLALVGCRQLFGIDDTVIAVDAAVPAVDAAPADAGAPDADPGVTCPATYALAMGPHRYRSVGMQVTWINAAADCVDDLAGRTYLAIPDGDPENMMLGMVSGQNTWIGLTDEMTEGTWLTVLGQAAPPAYTNWEAGAPDGGTSQNCATMRQFGGTPGVWRDDPCGLNRIYICECQ